jgi:very-short-patch-repair endonuclease
VCYREKIFIEVDEGLHSQPKIYDNLRDEWLRNQGFRILRFWNTDALINLQGILQKIVEEMEWPSPWPFPKVFFVTDRLTIPEIKE